MIRKCLAAALIAVAASAFVVPIALADKPIKAHAPFGEFTGQFCADFPVHIVPTTDGGTLKIFPDGSAMITGPLKVDVTNLETGKTIALNISGPAMYTSDGTTLIGTGRWLFFGEAGFLGRREPTLETTVGRFVINLDDVTLVSRSGTHENLCPALT